MQVFGKQWFKKNQSNLLWFLNSSRYLRNELGIDLPFKEKITEITPNSFSYGDRLFFRDGELFAERTTDFRTHDKFGKRLYYGFLPVWKLAHSFDLSLANRFAPALNLGFDTLTAYPNAGTGATTVDGYASRQVASESWGTLRSGAGTGSDATGTDMFIGWFTAGSGDAFKDIYRTIFTFDTSSLTSSASISAAILSLYGAGKANDTALDAPTTGIYTSTPASNNAIVNADYSQLGSVLQSGTITWDNFSITGYNDYSFNSTGISNISKTGISKFGGRSTQDANNSVPLYININSGTNVRPYTADQAGTANDPKLVVTYSLPSTAVSRSNLLLLGVG